MQRAPRGFVSPGSFCLVYPWLWTNLTLNVPHPPPKNPYSFFALDISSLRPLPWGLSSPLLCPTKSYRCFKVRAEVMSCSLRLICPSSFQHPLLFFQCSHQVPSVPPLPPSPLPCFIGVCLRVLSPPLDFKLLKDSEFYLFIILSFRAAGIELCT